MFSVLLCHPITIIRTTAGVLWSILLSPHLSVGHLKIDQLIVASHIHKRWENDRFKGKGSEKREGGSGKGKEEGEGKRSQKEPKEGRRTRKRKEEDPAGRKRMRK